MLLTSENYYSREANEEYLSVSQYIILWVHTASPAVKNMPLQS